MKHLIGIFSFIITIVFASSHSMAQNYIMGIGDYIDYANIDRTLNRNDNTYSNISGSPFLFSDFKNGRIKLRDGKIYEGPLRYDIYADQIEFRTSAGEIFAVKNPQTIEKVTIGNVQLKFFSKESGNSIDGIYELLVDGNYLLFEKHIVILKDPVPAKPYVEPKPARFSEKNSEFLIMNPQGVFTGISNKKELPLLDMKKKTQIEKFVKQNKIRISEKDDMIQLVNFLNK